jgi:integrase
MGSIFRVYKSIVMPKGATVNKGVVTWSAGGKTRKGKLTKSGKVSFQVDTWSVLYTDEKGKTHRIAAKTKDRSVAERILANYEAEIDRIRAGVVSRKELTLAQEGSVSIDDALEKFRTKMTADGSKPKSVRSVIQHVTSMLQGLSSVSQIKRELVEQWVADEVKRGRYANKTINHYLTAVKSFAQYLADIEVIPSNPLRLVKKLNPALNQKKKRRAMTADEVERLLAVADNRRKLIYRIALGTGLRSTELSLLVPNQIDFKKNFLTIEAEKTKNKKADILPIKADLVQSIKEWVKLHSIESHNRLFEFNQESIRRLFYADLKKAGIERLGADGRSIDVHSLRKTFGTMLANAGVPLTTTQRLMRHSTPLLTAKLYIDVEGSDMMQALEKLPGFS